jgi:4-hydroxy-3-methylbut-2-en-1-yl diphosphate synthase IspG/GcpE
MVNTLDYGSNKVKQSVDSEEGIANILKVLRNLIRFDKTYELIADMHFNIPQKVLDLITSSKIIETVLNGNQIMIFAA